HHPVSPFKPKEQRAVKSAADTLRPNPRVDIGRAITELAVGEALVSVLDEKGTPTVTERAWIVPPASQIGPITDVQRAAIQKATVSLYGHYNEAIDRDSAYEILKARTETRIEGAGRAGGAGPAGPAGGAGDTLTKIRLGSRGPTGGTREGLRET